MKKILPFLNFALLLFLLFNHFWKQEEGDKIHKEIKAERLSIVGPDGHLFIAISNPERQALVTNNGIVANPEQENRDLPGIIFFNRTGDEIGAIFYDGTDSTSTQGITFDQLNNDQVMVIMKDEYYENEELKRWYGMFLRERSDSISRADYIKEVRAELATIEDEDERDRFLTQANRRLNEDIDTYRMFLGREENENIGLFLYDSKGRQRIKLFVDEQDRARLQFIDEEGNTREF